MKYPKGIRFGVNFGGWFKNAGTLVKNPIDDKAADVIIDGIRNIKNTLVMMGREELADALIAEAR